MINNSARSLPTPKKIRIAFHVPAFALVVLAAVAFAGCRSSAKKEQPEARGIIIVNAPAAGEVRRVLVREGMAVNEGAPVVEIAVPTETQAAPQTRGEDPQARARRQIGTAQGEVEAARSEVVRTEVEVQRLTPLVASGDAPQAQLDGARSEYDRAQQRLQRALAGAQDAQAGLVAARQPSAQNSSRAAATAATPSEQLVFARASSAGTVSVINAQVGARVTAGQPLATLRADPR